jgi:hypothetical protein
MTDTHNRRRPLDAIIEDQTAPKTLKAAIERHLAIYDKALALKVATGTERAALIEGYATARRNEPARLLDAMAGKTTPTVDDVGGTLDLMARALDLADTRATIMRRTVDLAWDTVERAPFTDAIDDVLPWVLDHRRSTPWTRDVAAHVEYAWRQSRGMYLWHVPGLPTRHRFTVLDVNRPTEPMRRVWDAMGTDAVVRLDDDNGRHRYRATLDWEDLLDDMVRTAAPLLGRRS